jgi:hypothetical protein
VPITRAVTALEHHVMSKRTRMEELLHVLLMLALDGGEQFGLQYAHSNFE